MLEPQDQVEELLCEADELPFGAAKIALLEEAVQIADSVQNLDLAFEARDELMSAATFAGRSDIMLVAFAWCIAQADRDPERFGGYDLLWKFKWVVNNGVNFPQISRKRLEDLLDDMEGRHRKAGSTLHAVASERLKFQIHLGDRKAAKAAHAMMRKRRRDWLSDCPACAANSNCDYYVFQRQWGRAVQSAQPVLRGRLTCSEEPHCILANVLLPLVHLGRSDEAKALQRQGYRLVGNGSQFVRQHALHLQFLAIAGDLAQAKRVFERHLAGALEAVMIDERFAFLMAAQLWIDRLIGRGTSKVKVRLPKNLPAAAADGKSDLAALREWLTVQASGIARQFDARNGTTAFQQRIDELPELMKVAVD